jgi:hypothetical protein
VGATQLTPSQSSIDSSERSCHCRRTSGQPGWKAREAEHLPRWRLSEMAELLNRWDEYEAQALLSSTPKRAITPPLISRGALKSLQKMLTEELSPIEEMWERRN